MGRDYDENGYLLDISDELNGYVTGDSPVTNFGLNVFLTEVVKRMFRY